MKLMIIGHARHGKDTVAEMLARHYKMKFVSSSWWCAENVIMRAPEFAGRYQTVDECFQDRHNHRALWYRLIADYCEMDLPRMGEEILKVNDMYVGCRSYREFQALKCVGAFDWAIWVDRSKKLPPEPPSSMSIEPWMADFILDNNGPLAQTQSLLERLMRNLRRRSAFVH